MSKAAGGKILYLVRHARASGGHGDMDDHDRALNDRGKRDAPVMARRVFARHPVPQLIVSSSAVRALTTAELLAAELDDAPGVVTEERAYDAGTEDLLGIIHAFDDDAYRAMLVGHNPTMTDLINRLTGSRIDNVPACGIAVVRFVVPGWAAVEPGAGELEDFDYPGKRI